MANPLIRHNIWTLEAQDPWHPVIRAYAQAIGVLKSRPGSNPSSWLYQAAIHGFTQQDKWRNQCQHNSWYFLPWHRMYLSWFEKLVRATIAGLPGVDAATKQSWALPYWDYTKGSDSRRLPQAFRDKKLPG